MVEFSIITSSENEEENVDELYNNKRTEMKIEKMSKSKLKMLRKNPENNRGGN